MLLARPSRQLPLPLRLGGFLLHQNIATDDGKETVGRSTSPHGPCVDEDGTLMMNGGRTACLDPTNRDSLIVFHALDRTQNGALYLWLKNLDWVNDWPTIDRASGLSDARPPRRGAASFLQLGKIAGCRQLSAWSCR